MFSRFFIDRPILASVPSILITLLGLVAVFTLPVAQYRRSPRRRSASTAPIPAPAPGGLRHRGRADRAAGQRRRGHALHVVAVQQRRHLSVDGDLQGGHQSEHGAGAGAESRRAGHADVARHRQAGGRNGEEALARPDADGPSDFAPRPLRPALPEQLRPDQPGR